MAVTAAKSVMAFRVLTMATKLHCSSSSQISATSA
ncbi:Transposase [Shigella dysenteriae 1617]|uniref:Transposase n=1 Tax=Shigella dysenteriae 1617 TaxID=754093 RepID=A0A0A6ZWI4_SHIDY|nr:Transposase [Shigella dysenteriae 1617]